MSELSIEEVGQAWIAMLERGLAVEDSLRQLCVVYAERDELLLRALLRVGHVLGWGSQYYALRHIGAGTLWQEQLALALYCLLRHADDVRAMRTCAAQTQVARVANLLEAALKAMGQHG